MARQFETHEEIVWVVFDRHNLGKRNLCERIERILLNRLKPGFSHVSLIKRSSVEGVFTVINPFSDKLAIYDVSNPDFIKELLERGANLIETRSQCCQCSFKGAITCVSIAKYFLGIKDWRIITPWQLYKYLMKE